MKEECRVCECFIGGDFVYGGLEEFIINMLKNFTSVNVKYSVFIPGKLINSKLKTIAETKGYQIISYGIKYNPGILGKLKLFSAYKDFFRNNQLDVVHLHSGSLFPLCVIAGLAKKYGVKKVIVQYHSTGIMSFKYKIIKHFSDKRICKYADEFFACSDLVARWQFPKKIIDGNLYHVIKNGIDVQKFIFDSSSRKEYRDKFGLVNKFVLCNVARFDEVKNHHFIVELAKKMDDIKLNYMCFLVGDGDLKTEILKKITYLGLKDKFIFLEKRSDIAQIMMSSDVFIFPSLYEGLGIVAVEAQATGLPVVCSTNIPEETQLTDIIDYVDLSDFEKWMQAVLSYQNKSIDRVKYAEQIKNAGYDAKTSANVLEEIYLGVYNK